MDELQKMSLSASLDEVFSDLERRKGLLVTFTKTQEIINALEMIETFQDKISDNLDISNVE